MSERRIGKSDGRFNLVHMSIIEGDVEGQGCDLTPLSARKFDVAS